MNIVKAASFTSIATSGEITVDGVPCVTRDLVFVVDTIYKVLTTDWMPIKTGIDHVFVVSGTANGRRGYVLNGSGWQKIEGWYQ